MDINNDWDKSKTYLSPSKEKAAIFIGGRWQTYTLDSVIQQHFTSTQSNEKEFSLLSHWKDEDNTDNHSGTIKHFQD